MENEAPATAEERLRATATADGVLLEEILCALYVAFPKGKRKKWFAIFERNAQARLEALVSVLQDRDARISKPLAQDRMDSLWTGARRRLGIPRKPERDVH